MRRPSPAGALRPRSAKDLRKVIADCVSADHLKYNEAFLGMENDKYCESASEHARGCWGKPASEHARGCWG
eukprot:363392-Chlamydomonas_euryale.AAC.6